MRPLGIGALLVVLAAAAVVPAAGAFGGLPPPRSQARPASGFVRTDVAPPPSSFAFRRHSPHPRGRKTGTTTELSMVFDFFKKRSQEGLDQLKNLGDAAAKGKLGEGIAEAAAYTKVTNEAFATGLAKSRNKLLYDLDAMLNGGGDVLEELEDVLLQADLGLATCEDVIEEVKSLREDSTQMFSRDDLRSILRGKLLEALDTGDGYGGRAIRFADSGSVDADENDTDDRERPLTVLFVMGANGMGKTTTIGKLSHRLKTEGDCRVLVAACDTFRAGAVAQLEMWADRAEVDCYGPTETQKSPSAVLYGALDKALQEEYDTLIVDTSGRLSNNDALTEELKKMKRVIQKRMSVETDGDGKPIFNPDVPHETLIVIDAAQGRMALDSARQWHREVGLTGLVLTKLDGSAKGGSVVAVSRELSLPVKLIGVGEGIEDLRDFDPERFVDGLLGIGSAGGNKSESSKDEGRALASRLEEMRRERDERAKAAKKKQPMKAPVGAGIGSGGAGEMTLQEMEPVAAGGGPPRKPNRNKNKKKKKKKGKR